MKKIAFSLLALLHLSCFSSAQDKIEIPALPEFWHTNSYWKTYAKASAITEAVETLKNPSPQYWNAIHLEQLSSRLEQERSNLLDASYRSLNRDVYKRHYSDSTIDGKAVELVSVLEYEKKRAKRYEILDTLCLKLDSTLQIVNEYIDYESTFSIPMYIFKKRDYEQLIEYRQLLYQKYADKEGSAEALNPNQWKTCLTEQEREESREILDQLGRAWAKRKNYTVGLDMSWNQLTEEKCRYQNSTFDNEVKPNRPIYSLSSFQYLYPSFLSDQGTDQRQDIGFYLTYFSLVKYLLRVRSGKYFESFQLFSLIVDGTSIEVSDLNASKSIKRKVLVVDSYTLRSAIETINQELDAHPVFGYKKASQ